MPPAAKPPHDILQDLPWSFHDQQRYADPRAFDAAVRRHVDAIGGTWHPTDRAIAATSVRVRYEGVTHPDADEYEEMEVTLASDDPRGFTNLELLFKLHNAVVDHLSAVDHCYFEGLVLEDTVDGTPLYEMTQGS